jgi:hypothetical protein
MDANGNSQAQIGWGSEFWLANAQGVLVELDEVTEIPFAEEAADDVEVTHFKSPGRRKEYKPGLIEPGDGTITLNYIPGGATDLLITEAQNSGKVRAYRTIIPAGDGTWQVDGFLYVKSRGRAVPIGDRMTQTVSVRFTGLGVEGVGAVGDDD